MPKMTIRVILKSGAEFSIKCEEFTLTRNGLQQVTGYDIKGITENKPIYLDFDNVAAIVRTFSDEKEEQKKAPPAEAKKETFKEIKAKCPFCEGDNENATIYADEKNKEFFVFCGTCGIETIETYTSKTKAVKAFSEGKTKSIVSKEVAESE